MKDSIAATRPPTAAAPVLALAWATAWALSGCGGASGGQDGSGATAAQAQAPAASAPAAQGFDFEAWTARNAACQGDYFADIQDAGFPRTLAAAGIEVGPDSYVGEVGPASGRLIPRQPARLHGFAIRQVDYSFGSGSTFAVVVQASAEQAAAAIGARPLPEIYREYYRLGVATAAPSEEVPMPDIVFVRAGEAPGTQEIGCASFDM